MTNPSSPQGSSTSSVRLTIITSEAASKSKRKKVKQERYAARSEKAAKKTKNGAQGKEHQVQEHRPVSQEAGQGIGEVSTYRREFGKRKKRRGGIAAQRDNS